MKKSACLIFAVLLLQATGFCQQRLDPGGMNYISNPKPNSIIYHDTLFRGSAQFRELFYRQGDADLIRLYKKHQSNKIFGQSLSFIGAVGFLIGVRTLTSSDNNKGTGWALTGGGFATQLLGGYLVLVGQQNMQMAVTLFNQRQRKGALGIGVEHNKTGLVYQF